MKSITLWLAIFFAAITGVESVSAGTVLGTTGQKSYPVNFTNFTAQPCISVYGDWIENIDRATTNASGVTVTIRGKFNGAQNNSGSFAGKGRVDLDIKATNAAPGTATINLINDPDLGVGGETFTFTINMIPPPTVTSVDIPSPADPFNNIIVTLHGTGLQSAADPAKGTIVQDNLIPLITVGGNASVSSVRVLSSSSTSLQAQIFFTALVQDATVELAIRGTDVNTPLGVQPKPATNYIPFKHNVRVKSTNIKNYVKAITFPNGNTIAQNSVGTINLQLLFPAPADGGTTILLAGKQVTIGKLSNAGDRTVFIKLVPANDFQAVVNGTPINATGFTQVRAAVGDDIIPITFKVVDCGGGTPGSTNQVKIQTWMHNTNTTLPPDFVEQTFLVRCVQ
jgi:hypothetical protein